ERVQDRADGQVVGGEVPVVPRPLPVRVDEHVRDELGVPDVPGPRPNLEERVVARGRAGGGGGVESEAATAELALPPSGRQRPVLSLDVVDDAAPGPAQQGRQNESHALPRAGRGEGEDVLRAGVAEVVEGPALRPRADIDAGVLPDETGRLQVLPPCPAGRAVRVRGAAE